MILLLPAALLCSACSVVKAPIDLAATTISTTGKVACAACDATGAVASAVGSTASGVATVTRSVADVATSPAVQEVALESQGHTAKEIVRGVARR
ncbi:MULTISPECIES: hypothetical protein [unclassified Lentimonas]|uniref:hypothetical protein n=1 Tax=unclassified Lentimonas TaxID=2630993 RepID=UPI001325F027|nr:MULTISPECIES: hypothetical protein [unclassified Lentimonas]CAA6676944.1 Unannotated [Lentimonas sp. CC4]CAA6686750.1 Unannotated [Lentimonas sp. CC6]CAA6692849.1 Unannotated [Lentimonas sp. CC10]CAA6695556.1 Unannotated [Lentimonas sp. CC19]CAA7069887.1 Unannotated [Lentimonas sp. CC11]